MPDLRLDSLLVFDRGIDQVVHEGGTPDPLPQNRNLPPSEMPLAARLDRILALPNLGDFLQAALQPDIEDKELLQPARFASVMADAEEMLRGAAQSQGPEGRVLARAARVLSEEADLRSLLQMYRNMLVQG